MQGQGQIVIERVNHTYRPPRGRAVLALSDVSLEVRPREFMAHGRDVRRRLSAGVDPARRDHSGRRALLELAQKPPGAGRCDFAGVHIL